MYVAELLVGFCCFGSGLRRGYIKVDRLFGVKSWYCERFQSKDTRCHMYVNGTAANARGSLHNTCWV